MRAWRIGAALGGAAVIATACGASGGNASGSGDDGGAGDGRTSGDVGPAGDDGGAFDAGLSDAFAACASSAVEAQPLPLDLYVMLDTSGSMDDLVAAGQSKWSAVVSALTAFVNDPASSGVGIGLQHFAVTKANVPASCTSSAQCNGAGPCLLSICDKTPTLTPCDSNTPCPHGSMCLTAGECQNDHDVFCFGPGATQCGNDANGFPLGACQAISSSFCVAGDSCNAPDYATPAVPIQPLPGAAGAVASWLAALQPQGNTPTAAALQGAIDGAKAYASANPGHTVVAVLATDGIPDECTPTSISGVAQIAAGGVSGTPSIKTFAIGVFTPNDVSSGTAALNQIAYSGGTAQAFIVDTTTQNVEQQFTAALNAIRGASLPCDYAVPVPDAGTPDYGDINVQYTAGNGQVSVLPYVETAADCDPTKGGWYYDVDPAEGGTPTKILLCGASCTTVKGDAKGRIDIVLGCATVVR